MGEVLIVDDDRTFGDLLAGLLSFEGVPVTTSDEVTTAIDMLKRREFEAVVTDFDLGAGHRAGGHEILVASVRYRSAALRVLMSGRATVDVPDAAVDLADLVLQKPIATQQILRVLMTSPRRRSRRDLDASVEGGWMTRPASRRQTRSLVLAVPVPGDTRSPGEAEMSSMSSPRRDLGGDRRDPI